MSFKSVQKKIEGQGHSAASAGAILASATRHASPAAKRANPKLKRVKGKMHTGGTIPETGAYEMEKGEHVSAAAPQEATYKQGSEGSRICSTNLRKYPAGINKNSLVSPAETDHLLEPMPDVYPHPAANEIIRQKNRYARDKRNGWIANESADITEVEGVKEAEEDEDINEVDKI